jgi:hypothetical protein
VGVSQTAATTGSQRLLELKQVASPVTQQKIAPVAHLDHPMTELSAKSGQTSHATARAEMTVQSVRAGQTDLPMEIETQAPVLQIQGASVSQLHVQTVLGSPALLDLTDQTDLLTTEIHPTGTIPTVPSDQLAQTLTVLGNHVLQDLTDQSAPVTREVSLLVQTHASMTGIATLTARTASQEIVQEMRAL